MTPTVPHPDAIAAEYADECAALYDAIGDAWRELARAGVYQVRPDMTLAEGIAELAAVSDPAAGVRQLALLDVA